MLNNIGKLLRNWLSKLRYRRSWHLPVIIIVLLSTILSRVDWQGTPNAISGQASVRDGDSLVIRGQRVRLQGIDAPEMAQSCTRAGKSWSCGKSAKRYLAKVTGHQKVICTVSKRDRFNRMLADCRINGRLLNQLMVRDGMAVSFGGRFRREEAEARRAKVGLWAGTFERPQQWRRQNPRR